MRFSALYMRDYRLFWMGQLISFTGTWMQSTAQGWLVYSMTGSPLYLGLVSAASSLPVMLFSLFGGVIADRFEKRRLLIMTQAISILPAVFLGLLTSMGVIKVWEVMLLVALLGTVNAFDIPARHAFLVDIVERGSLLNAIALNSAAFNGARMIGPVVAGMVIAHMGLPACFYINALSFLAVIFALSNIKSKGGAKAYGERNILKEAAEGMRFVLREKDILWVLTIIVTFSLFGIPFVSLLPVFAEDILGVGAKGFGFLSGSAGIGAFFAAIYLAFTKKDASERVSHMNASAVIFPAALLVFSLSKNYYLSMASLMVCGWALVSFIAMGNSSIQTKTPDDIRGRVMSVYTLLFLGMAPLGNALMGAVSESIGTAKAVAFASVVCLSVSAVSTSMRKGIGR